MRVPLPLLALVALLAPLRSAASRGEQPPAVPSPTEIVVKSENLKTLLHWQYPPVSETPHFVVEIKPYDLGFYKIITTCVNTSAHFCDLSGEICDLYSSHWLRVKALIGSQQSEYVETNEFILQRHGKIGPPKLDLSRHGDKIVVDIYHPVFPLSCIEDIDLKIEYLVTFRNSTDEINLLEEDNCTVDKCSLDIQVSDGGYNYCVSARAIIDGLMIGTSSEESCIFVPVKRKSARYIIIACVVTGILSIMLMVYCGCKKLRKKNIKLPKSLVSVIRNLNADTLCIGPKSEGKYISVINFVSGQSALPVNGDVTLLETEPEEETVSPEYSGEGKSVPTPEAPAKAEEESVQESTEDADEQNYKVKESYFISDSSQMDTCSNSSGTEVSATETQQKVIPSSCFKFSGYDKPHVPIDMLMIDVGEEQPVNTYRPTD
ncbi:interferon gamma receptor 1 isoform X1 [Pithys albifrons albifrons]|uniref:interferon gamma receptor 1 isoform X1 n=1 Tax=Pithys albifrons albifrons TaxID=3385563 RepID=UPI003A5D01B4